MTGVAPARTGGEILVANLVAQGATHAFCVPGESFLAVLDALHDVRDRLRLIVCRQEGGAAYMAEACGKITGRPGIAIVTRGPGASNAAIGIHTAAQDSTPLLVLVGQVGSDFADREAFQEVDYRRMYGSIAKWVAEIDRPERIPEYVAHAYRVAMSGRPGPVVLALPEDMLAARATCADVARVDATPAAPSTAQIAAARELLAAASRPLVLVGGSRWDGDAVAALRHFAERNAMPVACAFRSQDLFDNRHPHYAGDVGIGINPRLGARVRDADVLLVIGERLGEMTTSGYTLVDAPAPRQTLIHVHPGSDELGRVYQPALAIAATPGSFLAAMNDAPPLAAVAWRHAPAAANAEYAAWQAPRPVPGAVDLWQVMGWLDRHLPDDAILTNGAGNYSVWLHRLYRYRTFRTQLAPYSGAMGYGVPSAVAAKAMHPERIVVSWNGDGCLSDERAGARHRGAIRPCRDLRGHRQRNVRHDPHASGAHVSGARRGHDTRQSGFRRAREGVRRARRDGRAHRGVRAGVRARASRGKAGAAARQDRSAGPYDERHARRAARSGPCRHQRS